MTTAATDRQTTQNAVFAATHPGKRRQAYAQLAAQAPVHRITLPDGEPAWLVTQYDAVRQALADPRLVKRRPAGSTPYSGFPPDLEASVRNTMLHRDPPEHTRLRKLVSAAFTQRRISALAPRIEQIVTSCWTRWPTPTPLISSIRSHSRCRWPPSDTCSAYHQGTCRGSQLVAHNCERDDCRARHPRRCGSWPARLHTGAAGNQTHFAR
jgi:hypothetical protein